MNPHGKHAKSHPLSWKERCSSTRRFPPETRNQFSKQSFYTSDEFVSMRRRLLTWPEPCIIRKNTRSVGRKANNYFTSYLIWSCLIISCLLQQQQQTNILSKWPFFTQQQTNRQQRTETTTIAMQMRIAKLSPKAIATQQFRTLETLPNPSRASLTLAN